MAATSDKTQEKPKTNDYVAQWPVTHDGEAYQGGDVLALTDKDAQPLLEAGCIKPKTTRTKEVPHG
jgi:hypothetical protein